MSEQTGQRPEATGHSGPRSEARRRYEQPVDRRDFVRASAIAGAAVAAGIPPALGVTPAPARAFKLSYAPHFGMFRQHAGEGLAAELEFMAAEGFTALEDNGLKGRSVADQELIGKTLERLKMRMGVFVAHTISWNEPHLATGDAAIRDKFLQEIRESVDVAKRVNAKWMTVVPGHVDRRLDMNFQTSNVVEALKRAAAVLEPHGLIIVIEPLNTLRDHPGQFLTRSPQAYQICRAVGSPSLKILFDIYHQQITEGNLIPNMTAAWDEVAYIQVGDNPGRREPGTGEINYRNIFRHIHSKGFQGVVGMEHGNSRQGREGERAVIDAYIAADAW
jgi:hydroxypyruvate isomerase